MMYACKCYTCSLVYTVKTAIEHGNRRQMYEKTEREKKYQIINMIYVLRVYCTSYTCCGESSFKSTLKTQNATNKIWTGHFIYTCVRMPQSMCTLCECYFCTRKKISKQLLVQQELSKVITVCGTVQYSTPVMSYAYVYSITHIQITCTHTHTRSLKNCIKACAMCDLTWFYFLFLFLLLLLLLLFCIDFEILLCNVYYSLNSFFLLLDVVFSFFLAIKFSIRFFFVYICDHIFCCCLFVLSFSLSFVHKKSTEQNMKVNWNAIQCMLVLWALYVCARV